MGRAECVLSPLFFSLKFQILKQKGKSVLPSVRFCLLNLDIKKFVNSVLAFTLLLFKYSSSSFFFSKTTEPRSKSVICNSHKWLAGVSYA